MIIFKRICLLVSLLLSILTARGGGNADVQASKPVVDDSIAISLISQPRWMYPDSIKKEPFLKKVGKAVMVFIDEFDNIDTTYIEPQRYNFTAMLQNTNTYEVYKINSVTGQSITFAPEPSIRVGPYFGWRWAFLGYTVDVRHIEFSTDHSTKHEYDMSLYTSMLGVDFYFRKTGDHYKIRNVNLGNSYDVSKLIGLDFAGVTSIIKGLNVYYVFNHRKFSYPAAFAQSTVQRRSAGTPIAGIGYTRHELNIDWELLDDIISDRMVEIQESPVDSTLKFNTIKYTDISLSGGYAYNWVFAKNWLLAGSLSLALGYKRSSGDLRHQGFNLSNFSFNNLNIDGIGRFGLVYNDTKWFAGMSAILHAYNYRKSRFSTNNFFGSVNIYFGVNFGRRKK